VILFDLRCAKDHVFEGWFRDGTAFEQQAGAQRIACPTCGSRRVAKAVMAPRIGKAGRTPNDETVKAAAPMRALGELRKAVEENCEHVGDKFAAEARRIHYREAERRNIYGAASDEEARELVEEGIEFSRIPWVPRPQ